jgi:predicted nucleic acid-binding Zn ribbon protein
MVKRRKKCVVCGAKIPWFRSNTNTCSTLCTRARNHHRTREQQLWHEDRLEAADSRHEEKFGTRPWRKRE